MQSQSGLTRRYFAVAISLTAVSVGCGGAVPSANVKQEKCLRTFTGHADYVCEVTFSPNGKQIVSGGADGKIKFWNVKTGQCERTLDGHREWVHSVALSPDGSLLASGARDNLVKLWDVRSGKQQKVFVGHSGLVKSVAYSPDGKLLASCGRDSVIRIWDVASGKSVKTLASDDFFTSSAVVFSPNGKQVLFGGDSLQLWDIDAGKCLQVFEGHSDSIGSIAISRNGKWFASAGRYTDRTIRMWDAKSGTCLWNKQCTEEEGGAWSLAFASDGQVLVSGYHGGRITFWDVKSGNALRTVEAHFGAVSSLAADLNGKYVASGSWDNCIKVWKVPASDLVRR